MCPSESNSLAIEDADPSLSYAGNWTSYSDSRLSGGTLHYGTSSSASITLHWTGTAVELVVAKGPQMGQAWITLDNGYQVVDLYSPTLQTQALLTKTGLPSGPHTLIVYPLGQKNPKSSGTIVAVDAIDVQ